MGDEFGGVEVVGDVPAYFPTDTKGKLVPIYNQAGRFTGQLQRNGRVAVDVSGSDADQTETLLAEILIELRILNRNIMLIADKQGANPVESV